MEETRKKPDHKCKTNLGKAGYRAMLVNLPAALKEYEGMNTVEVVVLKNADRKSSGVYNIAAVHEFSDQKVHLSLRGKYLEPFIDRAATHGCEGKMKLEVAKLSKINYYNDCIKNGDTGAPVEPGNLGNNRSSVKVAYQKFIQSFRKAINSNPGSPKQVLAEMDEDNNGVIDKTELLLGAHTLGIAITPAEMDMIWPIFGPFDINGAIPVDRFIDSVVANKIKGNRKAQKSSESTMVNLQIGHRKNRIAKKTQLANTLATLSVTMRLNFVAKMEEMSITCGEAFDLLDTDRGGTIDKQEFHRGLEKLGVGVSDEEIDAIWPLFNLDTSGTITKAEWTKFVTDKVAWSYQLLGDRFANLFTVDNEKCSAKVDIMHNLGVVTPRPAGNRRINTKSKSSKQVRPHTAQPRSMTKKKKGRTFRGSKPLYRRQSITRGYVVEPVFSAPS
jgi:Ca2+-binding EF-hand superfamily protein